MELLSLDAALALRHEPRAEGKYAKWRTPDCIALHAVLNRIRSRFRDEASFRELSESEQTVYLLGWVLDSEVMNGGVHQFLSNSSGNDAERIRDRLRLIGALDVLDVLNQAAAVFPNSRIPEDWEQRNALLTTAEDRAGDELWNRMDGLSRDYYRAAPAFYARLVDYVAAHRGDFTLPVI